MNQGRKIYPLLFALILVGVSFATNTFALDMGSSTVCGKDANGDGFFAQDELKECISGVCPLDTVQCDAQLSDPVCPAGGTLNTERDMCQAESINSCPTGYTFDQSTDRCTRPVECSDGGLFNPLTDRCEKLATDSCPDTYTLDAGNHLCWKAVDCGTGGTFNAAKDQCERALSPACTAGFAYNAANGKCEADPTCSSGTYNATYNKCLKPLASKTCPSGYSYVTARDRCERTPVCSSGTYNPATDKCENSTPGTCSSFFPGPYYLGRVISTGMESWIYEAPLLAATDMTFIPTTPADQWKIVTQSCTFVSYPTWPAIVGNKMLAGQNFPYCGQTRTALGLKCTNTCLGTYAGQQLYSNGGNLNINGDGTMLAPSYSCSLGGTYSTSQACQSGCQQTTQTAPTCPSGMMDYGTDVCYAAYTPTCDPGLTYDAASGQCAVVATCAAPSVLDTGTDKCTATPSCPSGYSYNAAAKQCEAAPTCAVGTYSTTYNKCLSDFTVTCPSGYSYVSGRGRCERTPVCANGTYNPATDKCESGGTTTYTASLGGNGTTAVMGVGVKISAGFINTVSNLQPSAQIPLNGVGLAVEPQASYNYGQTRIETNNGVIRYGIGGTWGNWISLVNGGISQAPTASAAYAGIKIINNTIQYITSYFNGVIVPLAYTCPSGGTLSGSTCTINTLVQTAPNCPSGTMDYTNDVCYAAYTPSCAAGTTYDAASSKCAQAATCSSGGTLNTTTDLCVVSPASCNGWAFDAVNNICYSAPTCLSGIFNAVTNLCNASIVPNCGTYTFNATDQKCTLAVACPNLQPAFSTAGTIAFSPELDICVSNAQHDCPTTYAYNGQPIAKCEAVIVCPSGTYDPTNDKCRLGEYTCPLGNYACSDINGDGNQECSGFPCVNLATTPATETPTDTTAYQNDGTVDPATGECSGVFKIFNGKPGECMKAGWQTTFFNCCDTSSGSFLIFKEFCPEDNITTVQAVQAGRTHFVGEYCKKKITLIGCVQKANKYCIFNSKMGRIIHEQGRPELKKFAPDGNWGSPEGPNCEGFTPEEFQMLDFSKIDLSEIYGDLTPNTAIIQGTTDAVQKFYNNIQ